MKAVPLEHKKERAPASILDVLLGVDIKPGVRRVALGSNIQGISHHGVSKKCKMLRKKSNFSCFIFIKRKYFKVHLSMLNCLTLSGISRLGISVVVLHLSPCLYYSFIDKIVLKTSSCG